MKICIICEIVESWKIGARVCSKGVSSLRAGWRILIKSWSHTGRQQSPVTVLAAHQKHLPATTKRMISLRMMARWRYGDIFSHCCHKYTSNYLFLELCTYQCYVPLLVWTDVGHHRGLTEDADPRLVKAINLIWVRQQTKMSENAPKIRETCRWKVTYKQKHNTNIIYFTLAQIGMHVQSRNYWVVIARERG